MSEQQARLSNFPISWFATVMGMLGFTVAWGRAETLLGTPAFIDEVLLGLSILMFLAIALFYGLKLVRHPAAVAQEFAHPVKISFFPAFSIALILFSIPLLTGYPAWSRALWSIGVGIHLLFTLYVMAAWLNHSRFQIQHMNPAWFIPVVGNILVPISGVHHYPAEISWFFFSIGLVFWPVLLTIVYYRVIFHDPLPEKLVPTMFILIAPPAVGFISWVALTGEVDAFGRILYYAALFLTLLLVTQSRRFLRGRFFLSWWAYSFPIAAVTIATLLMFHHTGLAAFRGIAIGLLALLSLVIAVLVVRTVLGIARREICVEE